ncbi:MAG TPA: sigma-54 dependent transcriptional regulator [Phycisphaerales bacterium]|nr:sigma-54 dependent transcriptional regulator [Phycisphaerales bacterium]
MRTVLIVDDKEMMRDSVGATLERAGLKVLTASDGDTALSMVAQSRPDAVVTDMRMPGMTGIDLLEKLRQIDDELPVILMTAFGTIETAVKAMKIGAFDYLTKPFEGDELIIAVKRAIEHRRLIRENAILRAHAGPDAPTVNNGKARAINVNNPLERRGVDRLVGSSDAMRKLREQIKAVAGSQGTVLITGESGVGKEVVARAVHESSPRCASTFLAVNCAALSTSLLESELFGHEKGAFTGAEKLRKGRFELSDGGTLLLDEVSEVAGSIQAKLLRVLQERSFERVGSSMAIGVDVRVVATSNRDLPVSVQKGDFRQDLYFRLNVLPVVIPPLRERLEDVPELVEHFIADVCMREGRAKPAIASDALMLMQSYAWPGNVRELQNICERAVVLCGVAGESTIITRELIAPWLSGQPAATIGPNTMIGTVEPKLGIPHAGTVAAAVLVDAPMRQLEEIEREAIVQTLVKFKGHRQKTAHALGIGVRTLGLKLKKWKQTGLVAENL